MPIACRLTIEFVNLHKSALSAWNQLTSQCLSVTWTPTSVTLWHGSKCGHSTKRIMVETVDTRQTVDSTCQSHSVPGRLHEKSQRWNEIKCWTDLHFLDGLPRIFGTVDGQIAWSVWQQQLVQNLQTSSFVFYSLQCHIRWCFGDLSSRWRVSQYIPQTTRHFANMHATVSIITTAASRVACTWPIDLLQWALSCAVWEEAPYAYCGPRFAPFRLSFLFSSKIVFYGHCRVTSPTQLMTMACDRLTQLPTLMQNHSGGEQGKMEKTGCKIICGAPTTLAVKGLMMMMMMMFECMGICVLSPAHESEMRGYLVYVLIVKYLSHRFCLNTATVY